MKRLLLARLESKYFISYCFLLFIGLRVALLLAVPVAQTSDFLWYYQRGVEIASGAGYAEGGVSTAFWPVGWPGLLGCIFWLSGTTPLVGQIANLVFAALTFPIAAKLGADLSGNRLVGRLTVLLLAIYPNQIAYVPLLSTEVFYEFLLLAGICLLTMEGAGWSLLAGGVFGVAMLTKTQTLFLPGLLLLAAWLCSRPRTGLVRPLKMACFVYVAMALVVVPWTIRNYAVFGEIIPVATNGGITLLTGNNPSANGDYTPGDPLVSGLSHDPAQQVAMDRLATSRAVAWIETHPWQFAGLLPKKVWRLWAPDGEGEWLYQAGYQHYGAHVLLFRAARGLNQVYYVCLLILAVLSLRYRTQGLNDHSAWFNSGWVAIAYFTAISMVFSGQSRFHFSLMPLIAIYAASTLANVIGSGATMAPDKPVTAAGRRAPLTFVRNAVALAQRSAMEARTI
jgi:hypothetical protein